jgi:serine/threonine-protein kinase
VDEIDDRADVWALSVVLYEMVTGKIPFQRANYNALMHAIINEDPTPSVECGAGDRSLWQIIERGLKKEREERFQTVTDLGEALALWLYEHGIKEDLSGNSIRAVWLDAALSGATRDAHSRNNDTGGSSRLVASRSPTLPGQRSTSSETVVTLAPPGGLRSKRALYFGLPLFALVLGATGAWLAVGLRRPPAVTPAVATAPGRPVIAKSEPGAQPAQPPVATDSEPLPAASAPVKPAPSASARAKPHVPSARKKGHDFGF